MKCHASPTHFHLKLQATVAAILAIPLLVFMFLPYEIPPWIQFVLATPVQFYSGYSFYVGTFRKSINMDTLVALGTSAAYGLSLWNIFAGGHLYFETSAVLITFILIGRILEARSKERAQFGMKALLEMQPTSAQVRRGDLLETVNIEAVKKGDIVVIRPGEKVPVDGVVVKGSSHIDESMLTGESMPVKKEEKSPVSTGTMNKEGAIEVEVTKLGTETSLGQIIKLVEEASASKPPVQKLVDRIASIFVPCVVLISIITFFLWLFIESNAAKGILSAVAVLVVACPCALGLATPMVIMVAVGLGAKKGILIKDISALEKAKKLNTLVIDKTGTITEGRLKVVEAEKNQLQIAGALSQYSDHPISTAITEAAQTTTPCTDFVAHPGKGLEGKVDGKTYYLGSPAFLKEKGITVEEKEERVAVFLAAESNYIGKIAFDDQMKEGTKEAVEKLKEMGFSLYLLSGDRKQVVEKIAQTLGIEGYFAEVLPQDKAQHIKELKEKGETVGMVGDGVNDAPALTEADVGFAIASGTDVAMESASIGLMHSNMTNLTSALLLARYTLSKLWQNLGFAFVYNIIAIPFAAFGLLNPMIAGAAMALSSISVVLNALTLQRKKII